MKRSEVPVEQTWDLSIIYKTDEDAWKDADEIRKLADEIEQKYKGKLSDADTIVECLHLYEKMSMLAEKLSIYFGLKVETDYSDAGHVNDAIKADSIVTDCMTKTAFVESEIVKADGCGRIENAVPAIDNMGKMVYN